MDILLINDNEPSTNIGCRATSKSFRHVAKHKGHNIHKCMYIDELLSSHSISELSQAESVKYLLGRVGSKSNNPITDINSLKTLYRLPQVLLDLTPRTFREIKYLSNIINGSDIFTREKEMIHTSDLVIINGEGAFYQNAAHARWMLFWGYFSKVYSGTSCVMSNLTLSLDDEFISSELKEMALEILPILDSVIFREPFSLERCNKELEGDDHLLSADIAFCEYSPEIKIDISDYLTFYVDFWKSKSYSVENNKYICVGGNSLYPAADTPKPPIDDLIKLINELKDLHDIILMPSRETDEKYLRIVSDKTQSPMVSAKNPAKTMKKILGDAELYIGGRYHPAVFALSGKTPVIGLSTKQKKLKSLLTHAEIDINIYDSYSIENHITDIRDSAFRLIGQDSEGEVTDERLERIKRLTKNNIPDEKYGC